MMRLESGRPTNGITPDLKQWDIAQKGPFTKVQFDGYLDTTELNDALITGAETWSEKHTLHIFNVNYSYKIHREDSYAEDKAKLSGRTALITRLQEPHQARSCMAISFKSRTSRQPKQSSNPLRSASRTTDSSAQTIMQVSISSMQPC